MSFSSDVADLLAKQLDRFVTLNAHQLAGQVANLDFWLAQVRNALSVIDGYGSRFVKMHAAQENYVEQHGTTEFDLDSDWYTKRKASPPKRIPDHELQKSRRALITAATRFLERCRKDGLIPEPQFANALKGLGIE